MTDQDLEREIERTREHLGETIDELAGKADLKARAAEVSGRVRQSKAAQSQAVQSQALRRRWPVAVAAGVLIAGSVIIRRRRRGRA